MLTKTATATSESTRAARTRNDGRRSWVVTAMIFVVVVAVYLVSPVRAHSDSVWTTPTARSLIAHGDVTLDEYEPLVERRHHFQVESHDDHDYYEAPLATSLATLPIVAVLSATVPHQLDRELRNGETPGEAISAALVMALAACVMFALARRLVPTTGLVSKTGVAVAVALTFAFATQAWSTASRGMWMHGPSMLCLCLALYCALRARTDGVAWFSALGAVLVLAYFVRPTNVVPLVAFAVWSVTRGRGATTRFAFAGGAVAIAFVALNMLLYERVLQPYFRAGRLTVSTTSVEALAGNLVSPGRGLFVFVPVIACCVWGAFAILRSRAWTSLDTAVLVSIVGYWVAVSTFPHWWGGWSYGPRLMADLVPLAFWFLPAAYAAISSRGSVATIALVVLVVTASIAIQAAGAFDRTTLAWNWSPTDVDTSPQRVWDWGDLQFLR